MTKHFCDRCGSDVTPHEKHYTVSVQLEHPKTRPGHISFQNARRDLCISCARELARWMTEEVPREAAA